MPEEIPEGLPDDRKETGPQQPLREDSGEQQPKIDINEFAKVQMRVGQVLEAEKIEGSRKLLKLKVDIGSEVRQVVAGISDAYEPEDLVNRKLILVVNLKPAKLMGVESNGMILAASAGGRAVLPVFQEDVPNGSLLK